MKNLTHSLSQEYEYSGTCEKSIVSKETIKSFFISFIWAAIVIFIGLMISFENPPALLISVYIALCITALFVIIGAIYWNAYAKTFSYKVSNEFIVIFSGVITKKRTTIPFSRIQNISISQGPFDRAYELHTVKIETAGFSASSGNQGSSFKPEGYLIGIKNPEKVESIINKLVHKYTQKDGVSEELRGYVFEDTDLAFDQFMAYIISKMNEGDEVKNRIKELRSDRGITQQDLAEKVDVTRQTILYLEKGTYNPSLKLALKIAKVFDITIEELFELEEDE